MIERFNFVHISDLHFAVSRPSKGSRSIRDLCSDFLDRFLQLQYSGTIPRLCPFPLSSVDYLAANRLANIVEDRAAYVDFVLVTGDVANTGSIDDLRRARSYFEGVLQVPFKASS